jgi:hypothetical protein
MAEAKSNGLGIRVTCLFYFSSYEQTRRLVQVVKLSETAAELQGVAIKINIYYI